MSRDVDAFMEKRGRRKVATGIWFYDQTVPMEIAVWAKPACQASSRFDEDDHLVDTSPMPETHDGFLYFCWPGRGEYLTIEEAKRAADAEPWGPVKWD